MNEPCCGTCIHRSHDGKDFICNCEESYGFGEYTMFDDCCEEFEEK